jgi:hypothetical protein
MFCEREYIYKAPIIRYAPPCKPLRKLKECADEYLLRARCDQTNPRRQTRDRQTEHDEDETTTDRPETKPELSSLESIAARAAPAFVSASPGSVLSSPQGFGSCV